MSSISLNLWPEQIRALNLACIRALYQIEKERPLRIESERLHRELRDCNVWFEAILAQTEK